MASSTLQKLLRHRTPPAFRLFTHLRQPLSPSPPCTPTLIHQLNDQPQPDNFKPKTPLLAQVYPSFSFEFFLNPVIPSSFIRPESDGEDEPNVIRADSVKKKRKKKMNKHKLKKLRKLMRRKT